MDCVWVYMQKVELRHWWEYGDEKTGARFPNSAMIEKMFEGPETFVIGKDSIKRCYIHSENRFVLAEETKVTKNFKYVLVVLNVRR